MLYLYHHSASLSMLSHTVVQHTMSIENLNHNTKPCHGSSCFGLNRDTGLKNRPFCTQIYNQNCSCSNDSIAPFASPMSSTTTWINLNSIIYKLCNKLLNWMLSLETIALYKSRYCWNHRQFLYPQLSLCTSVLL